MPDTAMPSRAEVYQTNILAWKFMRDGQYQTAIALLEPLSTLLDTQELPLRIETWYSLAEALSQSGQHLQALKYCAMIIDLTQNPDQQARLADMNLHTIALTYGLLAECAFHLPHIPLDHALQMTENGLRWLADRQREDISGSLYYVKGYLLLEQRRLPEAEVALTKALAIALRNQKTALADTCKTALLMLQQLSSGSSLDRASLKNFLSERAEHKDSYRSTITQFITQEATALNQTFEGQLAAAYLTAQKAIQLAARIESPAFMLRAYQLISIIAQKDKNYQRALDNFNTFLQQFPEDASALYQRARLYRYLKQYQLALNDINQAIELDSQKADYFAERAETLLLLQRYQEALNDIQQALTLMPNNTDYLMQRREIYLAMKEPAKALQAIDQAIVLRPDRAHYYYRRSNMYRDMERYQEALADVQSALRLDPANSSYWILRSYIYSSQKYLREALADSQQAISLKPGYGFNYFVQSSHYIALGQLTLALESIDRALELEPGEYNFYVCKAVILKELRRYQEALKVINAALEDDPTNTNRLQHRALIYMEAQCLPEALRDQEAIIQREPAEHSHRIIRALITYRMGRFKLALEDLAWSQPTPSGFALYLHRALLYRYIEEYPLALEAIQQAQTLAPQEYIAYQVSSLLKRDQQRYQEALEDIEKAIQLHPYLDYNFLHQAQIYHTLSRYSEAHQAIEQALQLNQHDAWIYYTRATIYWSQGQPERAQQDIEQAIELANQDERPFEQSQCLIIFTLFANRITEALAHFQQFLDDCQSAYFLQDTLFLLRGFASLGLAKRTINIFCQRLKQQIKALHTQSNKA
ncbi:tetratricopeptide repeat protein [Dictyobacter kobayashii]|uniref:Tetratricopeptide repeat protein n=1 Tax=Dictyobacter kobayashii TaxID=2014872 RepID=A0A402AYG0_9CHLR|nr:tetratricopeptide repeat protein [Dictyobacter kobayashii]GCE24161.1 hypothetical protein KDK_79610 [Dictyobacter kobayashii]